MKESKDINQQYESINALRPAAVERDVAGFHLTGRNVQICFSQIFLHTHTHTQRQAY
jgi:hypothetical protein